MKSESRLNKAQLREEIIKWRIKVRKFQREAIYKCLSGKPPADLKSRNANDKIWDVILFGADPDNYLKYRLTHCLISDN